MNPHRRIPPVGRTTRRGRAAAALVVAATLLLGGCGLRLDTPPPTEPAPDVGEVVRRTAVADAELVREQAVAVASTATVSTEAVSTEAVAELERIAGAAEAQVTQLGGVYDSGLSEVLGEVASPTPTPTPTAPDVVATLVDAAGRTSTAADTAEDGPLARLLASVSASHTLSALRLAPLVGVETPTVPTPVVPVHGDGDGAPEESAAASGTPSAADETADAVTAPSDAATTPPGGLSADNLAAIILAEDAAGYVLELRAARTEDDAERERMAARAALHRDRAQAWALNAGTDGTAQDPREVAYVVPGTEMADDVLVQQLEDGLATDYATLVGVAEPGTRAILVDLLVDCAATGATWGAPPVAFPGMPERLDDAD